MTIWHICVFFVHDCGEPIPAESSLSLHAGPSSVPLEVADKSCTSASSSADSSCWRAVIPVAAAAAAAVRLASFSRHSAHRFSHAASFLSTDPIQPILAPLCNLRNSRSSSFLISICHTNVEQIGQLFWVILLFFLICKITSCAMFHQFDMFIIQIFYLSDDVFLLLNGQSWLQPEWHQLFIDMKCTVTDG